MRNSRYFSTWATDHRLKRDCGIADGTPLIVWFGGASPHRGLEFIVDLLPHLEEFHAAFLTEFKPFWEPFRLKLLAMIESRGVANRVHILPMRQPDDLIRYASGGDVGVFCFTGDVPLNVTHSLPNKVFEMVMARLPIAATPLKDVGKIIRDLGNGIELQPEPASAAEAIRELSALRHEPHFRERLEAAARELCWEREKRSLTALYEDIANTACPAPTQVPR